MITEDYISFETAKLLKEKGFDETCRAFWKEWNGEINLCDCNSSHTFEYCHNTMLERYNDSEETNIAAPTLQMAMKWLRKVHKIYMYVAHDSMENTWFARVYNDYKTLSDVDNHSTYEEACEAAIRYCLENLI